MKTALMAFILTGFVVSASAMDPYELDGRIHSLAAKFAALQQQPDRAVPPDILRQATGIVLMSGTKAGLIFAYEGGSGVALLKNPDTGRWGPAAFVKSSHGSVGFQAGGEKNFAVIVLIGPRAGDWLLQPNFHVRGEARGVAGDSAGGVATEADYPDERVLIYGDSNGLFGGADVGGGAISPDQDANRAYYNRYNIGMRGILFDHAVERTQGARDLAATIDSYAGLPTTPAPSAPPSNP